MWTRKKRIRYAKIDDIEKKVEGCMEIESRQEKKKIESKNDWMRNKNKLRINLKNSNDFIDSSSSNGSQAAHQYHL